MASITKQVDIDAPVEAVWGALRDFATIHERLVPGFVTAARMVEVDVRSVRFFNGSEARERLVTIDDQQRRLVYSVIESALSLTHDNSSAQVLESSDGTTRPIWIKDFLPDTLATTVDALMDHGIAVIKQTIEPAASGPSRCQHRSRLPGFSIA